MVDLEQMVVEVEHRFAATPEAVFTLLSDVERMAGRGLEHQEASWDDEAIEPDGVGTVVRQRFQHGPGMSYLRHHTGVEPEKAEQFVQWRAAGLRANMTTVLTAAEALLS
jgi:hypothetical protein